MVDVAWVIILGGLGFLTFVAPAFLVQSVEKRKQWADKYFWLSVFSFWRPKLVYRKLSGYGVQHTPYDEDKKVDEVDGVGDVRDDANAMMRLLNKPFGLVFGKTPVIVSPEICELAEEHHKQLDKMVYDNKVKPYFTISKGMQLCNPKKSIHLIGHDASPKDAETAASYISKAYEKYRSKIGLGESLATIISFLAALGAIVFLDEYIIDGTSSGGGSVSAPIPVGMISPMFDMATALI